MSADTNIERLRRRMAYHRRIRRTYDANRRLAVQHYIGSRSMRAQKHHTVVNFLNLMVDVLTLFLAGGQRKALVDTQNRRHKPFAYKMELALNTLIRKKIPFTQTLRRIARDAIFGVGVSKTGMNLSSTIEIGGTLHDVGQPFVDSVDLDHFYIDLDAWTLEAVSYIGDRYRMRRADAIECGYFDKAKIEKIPKARSLVKTEDGEPTTESVTRGQDEEPDEWQESIWLSDVYVPEDTRLLTFATEGDSTQLRKKDMQDWDGPESAGGPYDLLGFHEVPLSVLPQPPVANIMHLHESLNKMARKLLNQTERQKTFTVGFSGAPEDAAQVRDVKDGEMILLKNFAHPPSDQSLGGPSQGVLALFQQFMALFNYFGYNVEGLGGLRQQAGTLGQEELMSAGAGRRLVDMAQATDAFVARRMHEIAWYLWEDPTIELPLTKRVPGTRVQVPTKWRRDEREGDFLDYEVDIVPYTMQERSPDEIYALMKEMLHEFILPLYPVLKESGMGFQAERFMERVGRLKDFDMSDLVTLSGREADSMEDDGGTGGKPGHTVREYVRRSAGAGHSPQGAATAMQQMMGGSGSPVPGMAP